MFPRSPVPALLPRLSGALLALLASSCEGRRGPGEAVEIGAPSRIVSLTPSLTEALFELGLGDRVVGVTRYCDYPPGAREIPQIGGLQDPNLEAVVVLRPDLVVLIPEAQGTASRLESLGVRTVVLPHHRLADIPSSFRRLGELCDVKARGEALAATFESRVNAIRARGEKGREPPRALIAIGRRHGAGRIEGLYVAGTDTFYHELLEAAGGRNVLEPTVVRYPEISLEGLLRLDPDVIIDLVAEFEGETTNIDPTRIRADWDSVSELRAVRDGRVHVLVGDHVSIPGPRLVRLLEEMRAALEPAGEKSS